MIARVELVIVRCESVELGVGEEVVCEECAGEEGVREASFDADERMERLEEVREFGAVVMVVVDTRLAGGEMCVGCEA